MRRTTMTLAIAMVLASPSFAAGLLQPRGATVPPLEIVEHDVRVVINNGFAVTEVDQVFHNPNDVDLEAIYTFPLPLDASLSELSLWVDGEERIGEVVEKERGREIYREERDNGRETALAEQREYHAFDVLVSPVRAGSDTRVRLVYLQPLEIDGGIGRYVYPLEEGNVDERIQQFWNPVRSRVEHHFSFACTLRSSYPLDTVRVKGYQDLATIAQVAPDTWEVWIDGEEENVALDHDVIVYYRLAEDVPARVDLLPYRSGDGPGTFLLVITPGVDLMPIQEGVDWSVVLDVSGSMQGDKLATAADGVARAITGMRPEDRFRVVTFSDGARGLMDWTPVTPGSAEEAGRRLRGLRTEGSTNLHAGFQAGLKGLEADRTSAVILVSDGGANVGPTHHRAFLDLLESHDVRVFTFVVGQGANVPLMRRLAEASGGFSMGVSNQDDLYGRLLQAKAKVVREAMHGVRVELDGAEILDPAPERLPSAYFGQQIRLFGRYERPGPATLRLKARISGEERTWETHIVLPARDDTYPELERLWALQRTRDLQARIEDDGEKKPWRKAIVELGTTYSIVTEYTSMIVVRKEQLESYGLEDANRRRVERERDAREIRMQEMARDTRADGSTPMFGGQPPQRVGGGGGGGFGGGALGPGAAVLLGTLMGLSGLLRRRRGGR